MDHVFALNKSIKSRRDPPKPTVTNLGPNRHIVNKILPTWRPAIFSWSSLVLDMSRLSRSHSWIFEKFSERKVTWEPPPNCVSSKNKPWNHETSLKLGKQTHLEGNVEICDRSRSCVFVANSNFISDSRPLASWSSVSTLLLYWDIFLSNLTGGVAGRCLKESFAQPKREMVAEKWLIGIFC